MIIRETYHQLLQQGDYMPYKVQLVVYHKKAYQQVQDHQIMIPHNMSSHKDQINQQCFLEFLVLNLRHLKIYQTLLAIAMVWQ